MMSSLYRTQAFRRAVALATCVVLPSLPLLVVAACAASDEADAPDADERVIIPSNDSGDEASFDAALDVDVPAVPCAVGNLCSVPTPLTLGSIAAINGRSKNDVWATGTHGLVMHWSGQQWKALDSNINETLSSIFLTPDEMWAASGTLVLRRGLDPATVRTVRASIVSATPFDSVSGIAALSSEDVYVSVAPGYLGYGDIYFAKLNFATGKIVVQPHAIHPLTNEPQPVLGMRALFLVPARALWLVGNRAAVIRYPVSLAGDGGAPSLGQGVMVPIASQANLLAAWGYDEHLWAVGENGAIVHFDGVEWHSYNAGSKSTLNAVFGVSPIDIWAVGEHGTVLHYDGNEWASVGIGAYAGTLRTVWASASDDVWIGGEGGLFHWGALP